MPYAQRAERGQVVVIFAISIFVFVGLCAIALDLSWYWANTLRMQRAADAAALAGVVHLPGDPSTAASVARAEAAKNGYVDGVAGITITAVQDASNPRPAQGHDLASPVGTFFSRVFGMDAFPAARDSQLEFVLPVPMGSPDAWYGVFGKLRHPGGRITTTTSTSRHDLAVRVDRGAERRLVESRQRRCESRTRAMPWAAPPTARTSAGRRSELAGTRGHPSSATRGRRRDRGAHVFPAHRVRHDDHRCRLLCPPELGQRRDVDELADVGCALDVQDVADVRGPANKWGRAWTRSELGNGALQVRLTSSRGSQCDPNRNISVDTLQVRVSYPARRCPRHARHQRGGPGRPDADAAGLVGRHAPIGRRGHQRRQVPAALQRPDGEREHHSTRPRTTTTTRSRCRRERAERL